MKPILLIFVFVYFAFMFCVKLDASVLKLYPVLIEEKQGLRLDKLGISKINFEPSKYIKVPKKYRIGKSIDGYWLQRETLLELITDQYSAQTIEIRGPARVKVECRVNELSSKYILEAAEEVFEREIGRMESVNLYFGSKIPQFYVCDNANEIRLRRVANGKISRHEVVIIDLYQKSEKLHSLPVWFEVEHYKKAWVAVDEHAQSRYIDTLALNREYVDSALIKGKISVELRPGTRLAKALHKGDVLTEEYIEEIPMVERGDNVKVLSIIKNITITAQGVSKTEGNVGDTVFVNLIGQKKLFKGRVIARQTVLVQG
ncbi:flagellar basal body P-ring formation chaperone FlgA [Microbulbifer sp. TYP-18]|uniref:flagellar basal body P-ring formation chaperone FlgA n=1 Tax=Microbulbifer sp. TYP-18 TaxID=3230024 RepID=UPI0034C5DC00